MNELSAQLLLGLALLVAALCLALLAYGRRPAVGWARAFSGVALISGLVFTISGIVNASGPVRESHWPAGVFWEGGGAACASTTPYPTSNALRAN